MKNLSLNKKMSSKKKQQQHKSSSSDFTPEFFKVFLPHLTAYQLRIPQAFVHQFDGIIPEKLILKCASGKSWNVEVNETDDGTFITQGWETFVKNQALCAGDFLVFRYSGNATFVVKIFGTNGCRKVYPGLGNIATRIKIEDETDEMTKAQQTSCDREQHIHKADPNYTEQSQERHDKASGLEKVKEATLLPSTSTIGKRRSFRKATGLAKEEVPYFIAPAGSLIEDRVLIPKEMVKKFDVKLKPVMFLCYEGRRWPAVTREENDGRLIIGKGWRTFWTVNNLNLSQRFMFKFHKAEAVEEIEVQILPDSRKRLRGVKDEA